MYWYLLLRVREKRLRNKPCTRVLVLVTTGPMGMPMSAFVGTRLTHRNDLYVEGKIDTGQWMIGIHINVEFPDFHDRGRTGPMLTTQGDYLSGTERLLLATVYLLARQALLPIGVVSTVGLVMGDRYRKVITSDLADKSVLQCQQHAPLALQTEYWLT